MGNLVLLETCRGLERLWLSPGGESVLPGNLLSHPQASIQQDHPLDAPQALRTLWRRGNPAAVLILHLQFSLRRPDGDPSMPSPTVLSLGPWLHHKQAMKYSYPEA